MRFLQAPEPFRDLAYVRRRAGHLATCVAEIVSRASVVLSRRRKLYWMKALRSRHGAAQIAHFYWTASWKRRRHFFHSELPCGDYSRCSSRALYSCFARFWIAAWISWARVARSARSYFGINISGASHWGFISCFEKLVFLRFSPDVLRFYNFLSFSFYVFFLRFYDVSHAIYILENWLIFFRKHSERAIGNVTKCHILAQYSCIPWVYFLNPFWFHFVRMAPVIKKSWSHFLYSFKLQTSCIMGTRKNGRASCPGISHAFFHVWCSASYFNQ